MKPFRTIIEPEPSLIRIDHKSKIQFHGSCFTENIGKKMEDLLFPVRVNPFGVVYNPLSVMNGLGILLDGEEFGDDELEFHNELCFSWDHHGSFSDPVKDNCLKKINKEIKLSAKHLKQTGILLVTFGTAWIYRLKKTGQIVANCHKVPANEFDRIMLTTEDIVASWSPFIAELLKKQKELKIIFTVSPVRHWKEGAHGNQLSKSVLLLAIDELCRNYPQNTGYFPAYELLLDDLRDYRFYNEDMLHPNPQAVDYIWNAFENTYFDRETREINRSLEKLNAALNHRPYNTNTIAWKKFKADLKNQAISLKEKYPFLNLSGYI
jgi:hypothetical protein